MTSCTHFVENWSVCLQCLPEYGTLTVEKRCPSCGFVVWSEHRDSPTKHDVYELLFLSQSCTRCAEQKGSHEFAINRGLVIGSGGVPRSGYYGLVLDPARRSVNPVTGRRKIRPMAIAHYLAHRIQERLGRRVCVFCGCLSGNRFRPVSFKYGEVRRTRSRRRGLEIASANR